MAKKELKPDIKIIIEYFDYFTGWEYDEQQNKEKMLISVSEFVNLKKKIKLECIGCILYYLVQYFPKEYLNKDNFEKFYSFYIENNGFLEKYYTIRTFVPFVLNNSQLDKEVIDIIKMGLRSKNELVVCDAAKAILEWGNKLSDRIVIRPLINKLINHVESVKLVGIVNILPVINEMLNQGWLTNDDINILIENLPEIYNECDYRYITDNNTIEISLFPTIRARCVKLARDILKRSNQLNLDLQDILEEAKNDALPEVRFAETDEFYEQANPLKHINLLGHIH